MRGGEKREDDMKMMAVVDFGAVVDGGEWAVVWIYSFDI
jgi:hypothetical protein